MYDSLVRTVAHDILGHWKQDLNHLQTKINAHPIQIFHSEFIDSYEFDKAPKGKDKRLEFDVKATLSFQHTEDWEYGVDGGADEGCKSGKDKGPGMIFVVFKADPRSFPELWEDIAMDLRDVIRHEIEHLLQAGWSVKKSRQMPDDTLLRTLIDKKLLPKANYFTLDKEVDAMLHGMYLKAKKQRVPYAYVLKNYLDIQKLDDKEQADILTIWAKRAKHLSLPSPILP